MRTQPLSLLFVCTANIARSPYAERRARMFLGDAPVRVASAGVPGYPGRPMDLEMAEQLRLRGVDPTGHVSRCLDGDILDRADVVLTFTFEHQLSILREWPEVAGRVFGLRQFADVLEPIDVGDLDGPDLAAQVRSVNEANSMAFDLDDPYGRGRRAAVETAAVVDRYLATIVPRVTGKPIAIDPGAHESPRRALPEPGPRRFRRPRPRRAIGD